MTGRVERWRAHGRVRWQIPSFRGGPQSGSHSHVSSAPPKIPYVGFSPVRLQAEARLHQPGPARRTTEVKRQVRIPSGAPWFGMAFVACGPSCALPPALSAGPPRATTATTSTHGPFAPEGLCCPFPPRYCDPIRQSQPHPLTSQGHWLYRRPCPTTWSGLPPRPSPLWVSTPSTRAITSTPGGETGPYPRCVPAPIAFLIA